MFDYLYKFRYVSLIAVVCSFVGSILMFVQGAVKTFNAVAFYFFDVTDAISGASTAAKGDLTSKLLVQSVDAFLFGLILMIFSFGGYNLFIERIAWTDHKTAFWLNMRSVGHLKSTLAELIVIILFVKFLELVLLEEISLFWESLTLPIAIGILALALKLLNLRSDAEVMSAEPSAADPAESKSPATRGPNE